MEPAANTGQTTDAVPSTSSRLPAATRLYMDGYRAMVRRDFSHAQRSFLSAFRMAKDVPTRGAYLLIIESLLKVAECKLATGSYAQCASLCSYLLTREPCLRKPALRHRLFLVRGLAAAGSAEWVAATADVQRARELCPPAKMRAMSTIIQRVENLHRQSIAAGPEPSVSCASCATVLDLGGSGSSDEVVQQRQPFAATAAAVLRDYVEASNSPGGTAARVVTAPQCHKRKLGELLTTERPTHSM